MLSGDDPRSYRHPSNAHEGQANSRLLPPAGKWLAGRLKVIRKQTVAVIIPEVRASSELRSCDPTTGVPRTSEITDWLPLTEARSGAAISSVVITVGPWGKKRLARAMRTWEVLFNARAVIPEIVECPG
ncbi:MAG TPA: hypothetical protein PLE60_01080 [Candidatus Latescibacteria bacterium]|nr:hypothetical protein [Candidatus Latescibacterota bacterium]